MAFKGSKLYAILSFKCPRCRKGPLFKSKSAYSSQIGAMHKNCEFCEQRFEPEPGFYFGAAYVSYGLTVALWVAWYVALETFEALGMFTWSFEEDAMAFLIGGIVLLLLLLPLIYRLSRSIWISMFVSHSPEAAQGKKD